MLQALLYITLEVSDATTLGSKCRSKERCSQVLVAGQYNIYCPAMAFDPPTQSVTYSSTGCASQPFVKNSHQVFMWKGGSVSQLFIVKVKISTPS